MTRKPNSVTLSKRPYLFPLRIILSYMQVPMYSSSPSTKGRHGRLFLLIWPMGTREEISPMALSQPSVNLLSSLAFSIPEVMTEWYTPRTMAGSLGKWFIRLSLLRIVSLVCWPPSTNRSVYMLSYRTAITKHWFSVVTTWEKAGITSRPISLRKLPMWL